MEIYVLDHLSLDRIGAVDIYESFIWETCFNDIGSFELNCGLELFNILLPERLLQNSEDDKHTGLIEYIEKIEDADGAESLLVKGRMAEALLLRRVAAGGYDYSSLQPAAIVSDLIARNFINPDDARRRMNLVIGDAPDAPGGVISWAGKDAILYEEAAGICQAANLGFCLAADDIGKRYVFSMYKGVNRTEEDNTISSIETVSISNLLANGEFSSGLAGWNVVNHGISAIGGAGAGGRHLKKQKIWGWDDPDDPQRRWVPFYSGYAWQTAGLDASHMYYIRVRANNPTDSVVGFGIQDGEACTFQIGPSPWGEYGAFYVPPASGLRRFAMGYGDLSNESSKENAYLLADYGLMIDLTAAFGAGKEPSLEWCDSGIYYDGGWKYRRELISFVPNAAVPLVFSRDRDTLIEVSYSKDITPECTYAYVAGANGVSTYVSSDQDLSGAARKEAYLDLSSIPAQSGGVDIPAPSYTAMLQNAAKATLRKTAVSETAYGKLYQISNMRYGRDFNLGDIVTVRDSRIGFETNLRITAVTEVWDLSGYSVTASFGDKAPGIQETVKLITKGVK